MLVFSMIYWSSLGVKKQLSFQMLQRPFLQYGCLLNQPVLQCIAWAYVLHSESNP
jgi:hypothetical protein